MQGLPDTDDQVVSLPLRGSDVPPPDLTEGTEWVLAQSVLHREDPALYGAWFRALTRTSRAGGRLLLKAPSRFHAAYVQTHLSARVLAACRLVDPEVAEIGIEC